MKVRLPHLKDQLLYDTMFLFAIVLGVQLLQVFILFIILLEASYFLFFLNTQRTACHYMKKKNKKAK